MTLTKLVAVEKRGGARRAARPKATRSSVQRTPAMYYKDGKTRTILPKRLGEYRFIICTDLEPDDLAALSMLTAWIKVNESFYDARNHFPIYGFIINGTDAASRRIKTQRAREFLLQFADILSWNDPEHHLYKGYQQAGRNIWFHDDIAGSSFDDEKTLVQNNEALTDDEYPDPLPFAELQIKSSNLFCLYLNGYVGDLTDAPGAICASSKIPLQFLNRSKTDAPLLYADHRYSLNMKDHPRFFRELDDAEEGELGYTLNKVINCWNDNILNNVQSIEEFRNIDIDDYELFREARQGLDPAREIEHKEILDHAEQIILHNSRYLSLHKSTTILAMLLAIGVDGLSGKLQASKFISESSIERDPKSNTHILYAGGGERKLLENMLLAAFTITRNI